MLRSLYSACFLCLLMQFVAAPALANNTDKAPLKNTETPLKIVFPFMNQHDTGGHFYYFPQLLKLALKKTEATDGPFEFTFHTQGFTSARTVAELKYARSINVMWTNLDEERRRDLLPIYVPLLHGMNSYRLLLIRAEDQEKFYSVQTLKDLSAYKAGSVANWPDTRVMRKNNLPVVASIHYDLLFTMLAGERFDYFSRGLYEVWEELRIHGDKGLVIEDSLMLHYHSPIYFFVNRKDKQLADRIHRGLQIAMADGSFDELFFSIPGFKQGYEEMINPDRRILDLVPLLPPYAP